MSVRSWKTEQKGEKMKFQNIMQTQLVIAGLATVLLFPGVTKGQEISNTAFDDGPNAVPFAQPAPAQAAPVAAQQITDEQERSAVLIWIGATLVWIGAIGLYARGPAKRLTRELRSLGDSHSSAPGS
jgi:hypothetical protein